MKLLKRVWACMTGQANLYTNSDDLDGLALPIALISVGAVVYLIIGCIANLARLGTVFPGQ